VSSASLVRALVLLFVSSLGVHGQNTARDRVAPQNPKDKLFAAAEAALRANQLDEAERTFHEVLALDPSAWQAYANLGVIHMRLKQWPQALAMLDRAEKLAPSVAGIRLNIGLAYYRQQNYAAAIKPFASVVRQAPDSYQARYLLGLCYFSIRRWNDTVATLEPLWGKVPEADELNYLYVLDIAAYKASNTVLDQKAAARMAAIGQNSAAFHMLMGKAHLNREEFNEALRELNTAAQIDPKLPFLHFNLGMTYLRMQDYDQARAEFEKDLAIEPDLAFTYEQLGKLETSAGNLKAAEKNYRKAVKLDSKMIDSHLALAKIEQERHSYAAALTELDQAVRLEKDNGNVRYFRGQVLRHLGREKEAREELATAARLLSQQRAARLKALEAEPVPNPELTKEPDSN
jgi:tetratricopeptide (TPR) repeat protein